MENFFSQLGLSGQKEALMLRWTGDTSRCEENYMKVNVEISGEQSRKRYILHDVQFKTLDCQLRHCSLMKLSKSILI